MPINVRWVSFGSFSGLVAQGEVPVAPPTGANAELHVERIFYLVAQLEAAHWGSVQSYDGCGMSGGPLHSIACQPKNEQQGSLFKLLRRLVDDTAVAGPARDALIAAFEAQGWRLHSDGTLRDSATAALIPGRTIRDALSAPGGQVPRDGQLRQRAERWLTLFHTLLSDPNSFAAQKLFTIEHVLGDSGRVEASAYAGIIGPGLASPRSLSLAAGSAPVGWTPATDLAMCVYHAHSVNAPSVARQCLEQTLEQVAAGSPAFPAALIHSLGTKQYGRWADTPDGKNRYDRTRLTARRSGLWPPALFADGGPMPADLPAPLDQLTPIEAVAAAAPTGSPPLGADETGTAS